MTLTGFGKWILAVAGGILTIIGAVHSLAGVLNNKSFAWLVTGVGAIALVLVAGDACRAWIDGRFAAMQKSIDDLSKEVSRATGNLSAQCDYRIGNIAQDFEAKLAKEADNRVGGWNVDRGRIHELEVKVATLEKKASAARVL